MCSPINNAFTRRIVPFFSISKLAFSLFYFKNINFVKLKMDILIMEELNFVYPFFIVRVILFFKLSIRCRTFVLSKVAKVPTYSLNFPKFWKVYVSR